MVDADGIIRGSNDPARLGRRYTAPTGEQVVYRQDNVTVTDIRLDQGKPGFRFVQPILYAGRNFGMIEVSISKDELTAAAATARNLLIALSFVVLAVVGAVSFAMAKLLANPVRRLSSAMADVAMGDLDFRISHGRKDEFGELFNRFNLLVTAIQARLEAAERPSGGPRSLDATQIIPSSAAAPTPSAKGTPFDPEWAERSA